MPRKRKKAKERYTWVFFVNAASDKEEPIVNGKSEKPRCLRLKGQN